MQFNLEKLDKNFVVMTVTVNETEVDEAIAEGYKRVVNKVNLPGFRKGHIPRHILEAQFGKEVFYEDAMDILVAKGYSQGIIDLKIEPIAKPQLEVKDLIEQGKPFTFQINVEVLPEVKLGQYKSLKVEKVINVIEDVQVSEQLEALRQRHAEMVLSDKSELEKGDFAVIDFEGFIDGAPFAGGAAQSYTLEIGSESFIPGFEEQLTGMKVGTEKDITVKFPDDYHSADLASKDAVFKVNLKEIKNKELPELDDEFAKSIGKYESIDQLKADLKEKLTKNAEREAEAKFTQAVIDKAVDNSELEVPETLIQQEVAELVHRFEHNLSHQGLTMEHYQQYTNKTEEQILEDFRPEAVKRIKTDLVLNSIAKAENIEVQPEELEAKIIELAAMYQVKDPQKLRRDLLKNGRLGDVEQAILLEKTTDYIKQLVK
jgi:trigger factor